MSAFGLVNHCVYKTIDILPQVPYLTHTLHSFHIRVGQAYFPRNWAARWYSLSSASETVYDGPRLLARRFER